MREAHPAGSARPARHVEIEQPGTFEERRGVARSCMAEVLLTMPQLVDGMDDAAAKAYNALPDRLFLIDGKGRIFYRGGRGPKGFKVAELAAALQRLLDGASK